MKERRGMMSMELTSDNGCGGACQCSSRLSRAELVQEIRDMRDGMAEDANTSDYRFGAANALEWALALVEGRSPVWVEKIRKEKS